MFVRSGVFVYIMKSTRFPGVYKIGISNDPTWRSWYVSKSMPGDAVVIFKVELYFAYGVEQSLHRLYAPLNTPMPGSGGTEWFRPGLPPVLWLALLAGVLWYQPDLPWRVMQNEDTMYLVGGGLLALMVLPSVVFLTMTILILSLVRLLQEVFVLALLGGLVYWAFLEFQQPEGGTKYRPRHDTRLEKKVVAH